jgi:Cys-tRNA(Pro)/Cys-tRNA(Cys) deacylase
MGVKPEKTNVMRLLDAAGIEYDPRTYVESGAVSGVDVAKALGEDPDSVFKTLVTESKSGGHYVFVIPAASELDLKKAAHASGEKAIAMIRQKELLPLTGYVHGGCSPIGMKKPFPTFVDETAQLFDRIFFSAGKIGWQVGVNPEDARRYIGFEYADLTEE